MNEKERIELRRICLTLAAMLSDSNNVDIVGFAAEYDCFVRTGRTLFDGREFTPPSQTEDDLEN